MRHVRTINSKEFNEINQRKLTYVIFDYHLKYLLNDEIELLELVPNSNKTTGATCLCVITCLTEQNVIWDGKVSKIASIDVIGGVPFASDKTYKKGRGGI